MSNEKNRQWQADNYEKCLQYSRGWRERNPEKARECVRKWRRKKGNNERNNFNTKLWSKRQVENLTDFYIIKILKTRNKRSPVLITPTAIKERRQKIIEFRRKHKKMEAKRNYNCENYEECLDIAAKGNFNFSCIGCDGKTIVSKKKEIKEPYRGKKRGPKPQPDSIARDRVYIDFTNYPELLEMLQEEAKREFRTLSMQLLYYIHKGYNLKKEE